jgi:hypothetical protein
MSERNGDRARFQKNRKNKLRHRQRIHALVAGLAKRTDASGTTAPGVTHAPTAAQASIAMPDEADPIRAGD